MSIGPGRPAPILSGRLPAVVAALVLLTALGAPTRARAQLAPEKIGPFAADVRGAFPKYGQNQGLAVDHGLNGTDLPSTGLGLSVDAHVYLFKWRAVTFGVGGEALVSRGHQGASTTGPAVTTKFNSLAPQISLNFGSGRGWSYLSGGIGKASLTIQAADAPPEQAERVTVINYGGGARWFKTDHFAFTFDVRFYDLQQQPSANGQAGNPHVSMLVMSAGIGIK
jgi:Outer membrane protein beta-barrel domain